MTKQHFMRASCIGGAVEQHKTDHPTGGKNEEDFWNSLEIYFQIVS